MFRVGGQLRQVGQIIPSSFICPPMPATRYTQTLAPIADKKIMKVGHFIIIGLVIWIALSFSNSILVYQYKGHVGAVIIIGLSSIIWLTNEENRERLWTAFSSKGYNDNLLERLKNSIQVGLIAIFSFIAVASEIGKALVRQSEGFSYIKSELPKNTSITDQVGQIEYIAVGNSFSAGISFKDSEKRLRTEVIIFGNRGQINADVEATKTDHWKTKDIKINK